MYLYAIDLCVSISVLYVKKKKRSCKALESLKVVYKFPISIIVSCTR